MWTLSAAAFPFRASFSAEDVFTGSRRHRRRVQAIYQAYLGGIAAIIRDGQDRKLIRRKLAADTLSLMWLGLVQTPAIVWLVGRQGFDLRQHCERDLAALCGGNPAFSIQQASNDSSPLAP